MYSIRALLNISKHKGLHPVRIRDISEEEHIPKKFLGAILLELRKGGFIRSKIGKGGGYFLEQDLISISLGRLIRTIDQPSLVPLGCLSPTVYTRCNNCMGETACVIRHVMEEAYDSYSGTLDEITLQEMLDQETSLQNTVQEASV